MHIARETLGGVVKGLYYPFKSWDKMIILNYRLGWNWVLHLWILLFPLGILLGENQVRVDGTDILFDDQPVKIIGLRCSNALISDSTTEDLINVLDLYHSYGVNTVSVFLMGSRFGDVKGYLPDGSLNPVYRNRFERILRATEEKGVITIVGCLYWSTSRAKEDLSSWAQEDANRAIANTARWLNENNFRHVILDPDNEGMAGREMKWKTEGFILAAKAANPDLVVANNTRQETRSEDLNMHFGPQKPGKPWFDSESTPKESVPLSGYWSDFSKEAHVSDETYYNYSRIGRYTNEMKARQLEQSLTGMNEYNGIMLVPCTIYKFG